MRARTNQHAPLREGLNGLSVLMMRPDSEGFYFVWTDEELAVVNSFKDLNLTLDGQPEPAYRAQNESHRAD